MCDLPFLDSNESFQFLNGITIKGCGELVVVHAKLLLKYAGIWDTQHGDATWAERFDRLQREQRIRAYVATFGKMPEPSTSG